MGTQWLTIFPNENNNNNNNNEHNNKHNSSICKRTLWDVIYLCRNDEWQCCTLWWIIHNFSWDDNCLVNESQFVARRRENNARIFIFNIIVIRDVDLCSASDDNRVFIYTVPAVSSLLVLLTGEVCCQRQGFSSFFFQHKTLESCAGLLFRQVSLMGIWKARAKPSTD